MDKNEKALFWELCKMNAPNNAQLYYYLRHASSNVLGQLFFNRMQGVAYHTLCNSGLLNQVNREFRTSLQGAYQLNTEKNLSFTKCLNLISDILSPSDRNYALLKGAYLCGFYPQGARTSNDIDILICPEDVTYIGDLLKIAGFKQGYISNNQFVPASRAKIIESRMMRGETVPFVLEVNLPYMQFLEVDINFSMDYKNNNDNTVEKMLAHTTNNLINGMQITTLSKEDFFLHLCCHLYKEATTYPWIVMKRDMTLYKYYDIYLLMEELDEADNEKLYQRAIELNLTEICSCVVIWVHSLLQSKNRDLYDRARCFILGHESRLNTVVSPADRRIYEYIDHDICERFFNEDRTGLLKEVQ